MKCVKFRYFHSLVSIGFKFLIIQIAGLVVFMTSNLIISKMFGPQEVTPYNIADRLFSVLTLGFTIIITPFWSAITDAYTKGETEWIRQNVNRLRRIWCASCVAGLLLVVLSPIIYKLWIGDEVTIPISLSIACCIYALIQNWNNIYAYALSGIGTLTIILSCAIMSGVVYIPLAIYLGSKIGVTGIVISLSIILVMGSILQPIQLYRIIRKTAKGIWLR